MGLEINTLASLPHYLRISLLAQSVCVLAHLNGEVGSSQAYRHRSQTTFKS